MSLAPLHRDVEVPVAQEAAFRRFVDDIGTWWPLATFSVFGSGGTVAFDGDRIVETGTSGDTAVWGTVTARDEPHVIAFTWHPGRDAGAATLVRVTFSPGGAPDTTTVALEHSGWEVYPDPAASRDSYEQGWVQVLDLLAGSGDVH